MRLPYFPGCTLHSKAQNFDASARAAAGALDIHLDELPDWTCCGATFAMPADSAMGLAAPTRILASAQEAGKLLTLCSFCYNTLKRANRVIQTDPERRTKVTNFIEQDYTGNVRTLHLLEVLRDEIGFEALGKRVARKLQTDEATLMLKSTERPRTSVASTAPAARTEAKPVAVASPGHGQVERS